MSGAEPCTGSNSDFRFLVLTSISPSEADGSMPSEPVSIAAISESMSPNRLSVTMTSNCFGHFTRFMPRRNRRADARTPRPCIRAHALGDDLVPEHAGFHDVALFHRGAAI